MLQSLLPLRFSPFSRKLKSALDKEQPKVALFYRLLDIITNILYNKFTPKLVKISKGEIRVKKYFRLEIYRALSFDMLMIYACQLIFLTQVRNFDAGTVVLIESIFWYLRTVLQVPGALIVEKLGNKHSAVFGSVLWIVSILMYLIPGPVAIIFAAEVVRAMGSVLKGIVDMPLLASASGKDYPKVEGNAVFLYFIIDTVCSAASGFLFKVNGYLPMLVTLGICVASLILSLQIKDVAIQKTNSKEKNSIRDFKLVYKNRFSLSLFAYAFCMCGILSLPTTFNKVYMQDIGVPVEWFGIILAILSLINAFSAKYNQQISDIFKEKTFTVISLFTLVAYGFLGVAYLVLKENVIIFVLIVPIFILQNMSKQPYRIYMKKMINDNIESRLIPKTLSQYFLIESLGRAGLLFISGIITKNFNIGITYVAILGIVAIPVAVATKFLNNNIKH